MQNTMKLDRASVGHEEASPCASTRSDGVGGRKSSADSSTPRSLAACSSVGMCPCGTRPPVPPRSWERCQLDTRVLWTPTRFATTVGPPSFRMIVCAGSIIRQGSDFRYNVKPTVANFTTDCRSGKRYSAIMTPTDMAKWVREALKHGNIGQAELARRLSGHLKRSIDRAAVQKMTIVRETETKKRRRVAADEMLAISEITGLVLPADMEPGVVVVVPHLAWVSAGALAAVVGDDFAESPKVEAAGLPDGDWIALTVEGTSMDRISPPDSVIFVNRRDKRLVPNACYIIADEEGRASYKRYRPGPMRFEPVTYADGHETLYPDEEPVIVGRVKRTVLEL